MTLYLSRKEKAVWCAVGLGLLVGPSILGVTGTTLDWAEHQKTRIRHFLTGCTGPFDDISDETYIPYIGPYGEVNRWVQCRGCGLKSWMTEVILEQGCSA
jgi:hypothetical protein